MMNKPIQEDASMNWRRTLERIEELEAAVGSLFSSLSGLPSARLFANTTQNINAASSGNVIGWNFQDYIDSPIFTHDIAVNNSRVQVNESGIYLISSLVSWTTSGIRYKAEQYFRVDGSTVDPARTYQGYTRNNSGDIRGSNTHITSISLNAGQYIEAMIDRATNPTAVATLINGESSLSIIRLKSA